MARGDRFSPQLSGIPQPSSFARTYRWLECDRIIYNRANGALFFDADGTGSAAQVQFASLDSGLDLIASHFVVF